jgi:DNA repair protein RecO
MKKPVYLRETGSILSVLPYGEADSIAKVFTKELGLLSFYFKNSSRKGFICFEPLTLGEFAYEDSTSSLLKLREFTCIDAHLPLRESLDRLESASLMVKALERTQGPELSAPALFALFSVYLRWMPKVLDPWVLGASFLLKLLKHEGLFRDLEPGLFTVLSEAREFKELQGERLPDGFLRKINHFFEESLEG